MINGRQILSIVLQGGLRNIVDLGTPPSLDNFSHPLTGRPAGVRRRAWLKLEECERRLAVASWAMNGTDPVTGRNHVLAEDCLTAFFQSFEVTLQILKEEIDWKSVRLTFETWLNSLSAYTLPVRVLRTIRHFTVHIGDLRASSSMAIPVFPKSNEPFVSRTWLLPGLDAAHLKMLKSPKMTSKDLPTWNQLRKSRLAQEILVVCDI